jgi:hypothetical protein
MQVTRQHVVDVLRRAGFAEMAEEVSRALPDPVDMDDVHRFLEPRGISREMLTNQMGGSP